MVGRPEGVASCEAPTFSFVPVASRQDVPTPSVAFGDISPSRGEIMRSAAFANKKAARFSQAAFDEFLDEVA